jgi:hypothetical protein
LYYLCLIFFVVKPNTQLVLALEKNILSTLWYFHSVTSKINLWTSQKVTGNWSNSNDNTKLCYEWRKNVKFSISSTTVKEKSSFTVQVWSDSKGWSNLQKVTLFQNIKDLQHHIYTALFFAFWNLGIIKYA